VVFFVIEVAVFCPLRTTVLIRLFLLVSNMKRKVQIAEQEEQEGHSD
jgi:hypothetical protein